ncbi:radical SAM protein [Ruminococcus sp.]|uniref:radical SAM protein n=1 Tax=Ruminococcus sp. TaxID=41978 RepID=UPI0025FD493B|nr:radical SAM protein [Ruminococcus sp.]MBR1432700.1 radical SAM protein [Ruminococcus sp.]
MEKTLSKYVRIIRYDKNTILIYNTINRGLVALKNNMVDIGNHTVKLEQNEIESLDEMGFFKDEKAALSEYESVYFDDNQMVISIETHLKCNLACPYCYQNGGKNAKVIDNTVLDLLYDHIVATSSENKPDRIIIKVLGGEPTIEWSKCSYILDRVHDFCKEKSIEFVVMVDTNGTNAEELLRFDSYDRLILTVPLIEKSLHDKVRKDSKNGGTYDVIINNINKLIKEKNNLFINLRYNVDFENKDYFEKFVEDIKTKLPSGAYIYTNYVMNLTECGYQNKMSLRDFNKWVTDVSIPALIRNKVPITAAPSGAKAKCQCFGKNSFKVFSDGTIGPCAMFFFSDRISFDDYLNKRNLPDYWKKTKELNILNTECSRCDKLFVCNGAKYMPCISSVCKNPCTTLNGEIDFYIDDYVKLYYECVLNDCEGLFVGFEDQILR